MKKIMIFLSTFVVLFVVFFASLTNVSALNRYAYSIGTNYGGFWPWQWDIDTSGDAKLASNAFADMGWSSFYNDAPTYSYFTGKNPNNTSLYRIESSILFFSAHGNSDGVYFDYKQKGGDYKTGIYRTNYNWTSESSGYKYVGLGNYRMYEVNMIVFGGCKTAEGSNNITKYAVDQGVDVAIGWEDSVNADAHTKWFNNFLYMLKTDSTVERAVSYANGFTYTDSRVKTAKIYGDRYLHLKHLYWIASTPTIHNKVNEYEINTIVENDNINDVIEKNIKTNITTSYNKEDFVLEITETEIQTIYDYILYVDGIRTDLGYTVFEENGKITKIYDNMNGKNVENLKQKITKEKNSLITKDIEKSSIKNDAIEKAKMKYNDYQINIEKEFEYFDTASNKLYYVVRMEVRNLAVDSYYVFDYKEEI